jgi:hypothetical protein
MSVRSDNCYLYSITNKVNGKLYVGIAKNPRRRFASHGCKAHLSKMAIGRAINKYGRDSFELKILLNASREYCAEMEKKAIVAFGSLIPAGYNISQGGEGASLPAALYTEARREHLRKLFTGRPIPQEQRKKIANTLRGRPLTKQTKAKLSEVLKGRIISAEHRAKTSAALMGKPKSEQARQNMSKAKLGSSPSAESKAKHSETLRKRWQEPEFRKMMMDARKKGGVS